MKRLLTILFLLIGFTAKAQVNEYRIRANMYLIADSLLVIGNDTLSGTTQINGTDTIFVTLDYLEANFLQAETDPIYAADSSGLAKKLDLHDAATLTGTGDYLTLSGQQFTKSLIDTTSSYINRSNWETYINSLSGGSLWTQSGSDIYYDSGNVGIGTTSPAYKLDVAGTAFIEDSVSGSPILTIKQNYANNPALRIVTNGSSSLNAAMQIRDNTTAKLEWYNDGWFEFAENTSEIPYTFNPPAGYGRLFGYNGKIWYRAGGNLYDLTAGGTGGGASNFLELTDTPSSYSGQSGKFVKVNSTSNGLEFATSTGTSVWTEQGYGIDYQSGNVGIGTTAGQYTGLSIAGSWASGGAGLAAVNTSSFGKGAYISGNSTSISYPLLQIDKYQTSQFTFIGDGSMYQRDFSGTLGTVPANYGQWYVSGGKPYFRYGTTSYDLSDTGSGSVSLWTEDTNGITYTSGNVGVGGASVTGYDLYVENGVKINSGVLFASQADFSSNLSVSGALHASSYIRSEDYLSLKERTTHPSASSDWGNIYSLNDGKLYYKNDNGTEFDLTAGGTGSGSGTVTSVSAGNGMDFSTITSSGSVTLGTPSTLTNTSTNSTTATSHTHKVTGFQKMNTMSFSPTAAISLDAGSFASFYSTTYPTSDIAITLNSVTGGQNGVIIIYTNPTTSYTATLYLHSTTYPAKTEEGNGKITIPARESGTWVVIRWNYAGWLVATSDLVN